MQGHGTCSAPDNQSARSLPLLSLLSLLSYEQVATKRQTSP